jgi:DNA replication protein DnaC
VEGQRKIRGNLAPRATDGAVAGGDHQGALQVAAHADGRHAVRQPGRTGDPGEEKTLEEFDYTQSPNVTAAKRRDLAEGGYIERAEPVLFIGECGTGKTHLLTGLCVAACQQKRRVRFTTAAGLVNEPVEAKHQLQFRRVMARWSRYDLIAIDKVGYVPLAEVGAEFLFQVWPRELRKQPLSSPRICRSRNGCR